MSWDGVFQGPSRTHVEAIVITALLTQVHGCSFSLKQILALLPFLPPLVSVSLCQGRLQGGRGRIRPARWVSPVNRRPQR